LAIGPVAHYRLAPIEVPEYPIDNPAEEWARLQTAIQTAQHEIEALKQQALAQVGAGEAAIFDAHLLFLADPALVETAHKYILEQALNAEAAWHKAITEIITTYQALEDAYLQARAADVADVGQRVLRLLTGAAPTPLALAQPAILVAIDLAPSDTAQLDPRQVLGLCVARGSATAHSAILARSLGIPAVVGLGEQVSDLNEGTLLALDGTQGWIWVEPDPVAVSELQSQRQAWLVAQQAAQTAAQQPALTRDGQQVKVVANIGGLADVQVALDNGAEGVGLLRTEFLYLNRTTPPSEEEQFVIYRAIAEKLGERPLIIRTLDIGGDKPLPYLDLGNEANPFLGWRGIRFCLDQPDLFKTQLRAILRASPGHHFKLMFPMVSAIAEVRAAKVMLAEVQTDLRQAGIPFAEDIEVGIMVEVPAVVAIADQMAQEVDFFSIGTNDLSQYTTAADRTNSRVAALADPFHPAVLRLIHQTIEVAHAAGIWVGLCGEFAGQPLATPLLLGLGLDEFSMSAPAIPLIKQKIRELSQTEAQTIAADVLKLDSAETIKQYLEKFFTEREGQ
jgi:phosphocarrier protein FPr